MIHVQAILGDAGEPGFSGRRVERLLVDSSEAAKPRLRRRTDAGKDVAVDLPRGSYLRDGAVLADDGETIVVVARKPEEAAIVRLSPELSGAELLSEAVRLGHAFGNQHVPLEIEGEEIRVRVTTSREIVAETLQALALRGASVSFGAVPFALERPSLHAGHEVHA
jgi:urease accessory protein